MEGGHLEEVGEEVSAIHVSNVGKWDIKDFNVHKSSMTKVEERRQEYM